MRFLLLLLLTSCAIKYEHTFKDEDTETRQYEHGSFNR